MAIQFTNDEIKRIIEMKTVGDFYPYDIEENDENAIDDYLKHVAGSLARVNNLAYEADFEHYGSGYASYVDCFCWKRDGSSTQVKDREQWIEGIRIYLCRLAPVAVFGEGIVTKHINGGSSDFISYNTVDTLPPGDWEMEIQGIKKQLESFNFQILEREDLKQFLPFKAEIPTIMSNPPYRLFDAFFYWED
ncbi:hypothetical protein [Paucisalibacillus globulus]|uniref:hypothetical protein n=1 Tax=Paucisalibacillus globulus TaxID=351095 RepID=UPI00041CA16A|nr:hypothetical protein [Paucisalibacillus globulus]